jgi:hypothetical protein
MDDRADGMSNPASDVMFPPCVNENERRKYIISANKEYK